MLSTIVFSCRFDKIIGQRQSKYVSYFSIIRFIIIYHHSIESQFRDFTIFNMLYFRNLDLSITDDDDEANALAEVTESFNPDGTRQLPFLLLYQ